MMNALSDIGRALARSRMAATAIEYALIAGLVAVVIVGALTLIGDDMAALFGTVAAAFG
jgi:pilus assembly protein Flp/PilA